MRNVSKLLVMVGVLGIAGVANAKGHIESHSHKAKASAAKKPAAQPRAPAASAAPNRAPKAAEAAAAPAQQQGDQMVLADYAPDRHALAGP
jgi:hypothetical protein